MASSEVEVANSALDWVGAQAISSIGQNTEAARLCKRNIPIARKALIRQYRWNFAFKRATLGSTGTAPDFGFSYQFQKPTDMLHLVGVWDEDRPDHEYTTGCIEHRVEGDKILANYDPLYIFYSRDVEDVTKWDDLFVDLMGLDLAIRIAYRLTSGNARSRLLADLTRFRLDKAKAADAMEGTPEPIYASTWLDARGARPFSGSQVRPPSGS